MAVLYFAVFPSATTPTWARANIATNAGYSGSPAMYGTQDPAAAAPQTDYEPTISWTGSLSAGTAYKIWAIWDDGTNTSNSGSPFGSAEFKTPYLLSAESGTFALTGNAASLLAQRTLTAEAGSYTLTGNTVDLTYTANTPTLTAEAASFTLTGNDVGLFANRVLSAETGTFALTGGEALFSRVSVLYAETGAFTLTGNTASLVASRILATQAGSFTLTGGGANLSRQLVLSAETGNYTYTGNDAALYKVYLLSAATGEFQLTGNNIELLLSRRLLADSGAFTLTGNNATLIKTGGGGSSAADIWGYVLSNGMTAEEALVAVYTALHKEGGVLTVGKFLGLK